MTTKSAPHTVASVCLYGPDANGRWAAIVATRLPYHRTSVGYAAGDSAHLLGSGSEAVWSAVAVARALSAYPNGMISVHEDKKVPGGRQPYVAYVDMSKPVPCYGDLDFQVAGEVC